MSTFNLPELGEGLEEGEIVGWKVKEGDTVQADSTMVEVMTDKATIEVPAPASGKVSKLHHKVGDVAQVGQALIDIEVEGSASNEKEEEVQEEEETKREATTGSPVNSGRPQASAAAAQTASPSSSSGTSKVLASPAVRKKAREMGVDLSTISGSGDRGRVLRQDLESVTEGSGTSSSASIRSLERDERIPFVGVRRKIAEQLSKSMYTAVHFTHHDEADFSEVIRLREEANTYAKKNGMDIKVSFLPFYVKAVVAGLKKHPILNSYLDEKTNEVVLRKEYHIGFSVQTDQGLKVAVVRDCDRKDVFEIAKDLRDVVERARTGKATVQDLTGSTITVTSVGNIGGLHATPVINYPEVAIVGLYQIKKRPIAIEVEGEDQLAIRPMAYVNITCDHRIVDGAIAAEFMRLVCDYIENPGRLAFF